MGATNMTTNDAINDARTPLSRSVVAAHPESGTDFVVKELLRFLVLGYQKTVRPLIGQRCRFYPSCSHYALGCLELYPAPRAAGLILSRLCRCQPWNPGGFDYP
jgi:putative membrane protein insertion efficiency factor